MKQNALDEIADAIRGARMIVAEGNIWEDEHGEVWEHGAPPEYSEDFWVDIAKVSDRETGDDTHWRFYDLALSALYLAGEIDSTGDAQVCSDGIKRTQVRLSR